MKQEILNKYYINLDYNNDKEKVTKEILDLCETVTFDNEVNLVGGVKKLIDTIERNISLFKSACRHIDVIVNILDYLILFISIGSVKGLSLDTENLTYEAVLFSLFTICKEPLIRSVLLYPIYYTRNSQNYENFISATHSFLSTRLERKMIILEDSDLYAVIYNLKITYDFPLHKIWVQEQVKEKFLWLVKKHYKTYSMIITIDTFQSLKDIQLNVCDMDTISLVSIWSEDIATAKNLALSLNSHVIFINTYMEFIGGIVFFPYRETTIKMAIQENLDKLCEIKSDSSDTEQSENVIHSSHLTEINFTSIYNLFYDGTWHEPIKGMYWKHNDNLWAITTNDDIIRCYDSAKKGFDTWSIKSLKAKIQILSKFVTILKLVGKPLLVAIVEKWLKFPYMFDTEGCLSQNAMIEITKACNPLGVIILREKHEHVLFFRLMQCLIAGNSVIVMYDKNFFNLTPYFDMFSTCGIPPGVINLLSHEDTSKLEHKLCLKTYTDYANEYFLKSCSNETYIRSYKKLTIVKYIVLYLK